MSAWRKLIERPLAAAMVCSLLVLPARAIGHEAAQAFRRLFDHVVSKSDTLFALATRSKETVETFRFGQAWGTWILYGLVAGVIAMLITRRLVGHALHWADIALVLAVWIAVYFFVWNWDSELKFILTNFQFGGPRIVSGPLPLGGSVGFFSGLAAGLTLAATPWRAVNPAPPSLPQK
jgi:hypothetical protein